ncbi:hypothetical protein, variant [Verruconis gallopava]|uniref:Uncharacterized protein n=1 Tax=Verruconis gallopava TaxID=253628 RepID=A0A0D2AJJ8_9PEZI|nr:uncharacterized protein PV09_02453 [Verruconis gallopava]XP_016216634.1 hypothetical protein, variant [Verruconis gallopava]KIW06764.1 hypothetical protein PV09_02453 [Verruconis gallopava]KIW06765.1 hypothetical protein, variant [Verruconis gallopava]
MMLLVATKQQTVALDQCPFGYSFYTCNNSRVVWTGCCLLDPCNTGCPADSQATARNRAATQSFPTASISANMKPRAVESTPGLATDSTISAANTVTRPPSAAKTTSIWSSSTALGGDTSPDNVSKDPSTQTLINLIVDDGNESSSSGSDVPAIVGATVGALVLAALISTVFFCYRRRKFRTRRQRRSEATAYKSEKRNFDIRGAALGLAKPDMARTSREFNRKAPLNACNNSSTYPSVDLPLSLYTLNPALKSKPTSEVAEIPVVTSNISTADSSPRPLECYDPQGQSKAKQSSTWDPNALHHSDASNFDVDPSSSSRLPHAFAYDRHSGHDLSGLASGKTPTIESSSVLPALVSERAADTKQHTGSRQEHRTSRATGATFTPAPGATTVPSIKVIATKANLV